MRTLELFLIYTILFILKNGCIFIGDKIFKFNFKYYLFLNISTLLSIKEDFSITETKTLLNIVKTTINKGVTGL